MAETSVTVLRSKKGHKERASLGQRQDVVDHLVFGTQPPLLVFLFYQGSLSGYAQQWFVDLTKSRRAFMAFEILHTMLHIVHTQFARLDEAGSAQDSLCRKM